MTDLTFRQILLAAERQSQDNPTSAFYREIDHVADPARVNADDTLGAGDGLDEEAFEKAWSEIGMSSLACLLAYHPERKVRDWFTRRGVSF